MSKQKGSRTTPLAPSSPSVNPSAADFSSSICARGVVALPPAPVIVKLSNAVSGKPRKVIDMSFRCWPCVVSSCWPLELVMLLESQVLWYVRLLILPSGTVGVEWRGLLVNSQTLRPVRPRTPASVPEQHEIFRPGPSPLFVVIIK